MPDTESRLPVRPSLEQLQKQAKELLRQYRSGDGAAQKRFAAADSSKADSGDRRPVSLADAQFVLAREYGFDTWASLKGHIQTVRHLRVEPYQKLAQDVVRACPAPGDAGAVERLGEFFGGQLTAESMRNRVLLRLHTSTSSLS